MYYSFGFKTIIKRRVTFLNYPSNIPKTQIYSVYKDRKQQQIFLLQKLKIVLH